MTVSLCTTSRTPLKVAFGAEGDLLNCFSPDLHAKIERLSGEYGQVAANIEQMHARLLQFRIPSVEVLSGNKSQEVLGKIFLLWQIHLHRVERLMVTAGAALWNDDIHGFATVTRAIVESTGVVGAILHSFLRWTAARTTVEQVSKDVHRALVGMKGGKIEAKNVMSWIETADELIERTFPEKLLPNPLMSTYSSLSEVCHPNLLSNLHSVSKISGEAIFEIAHRSKLDREQAMLLGSLSVVTRLFMDFSNSYNNLLLRGLPKPGSVDRA